MLLRSDRVPAKIMHTLFSVVREGEACRTAVALGQVENPVGERTGSEVVSRDQNALPDTEHPTNELGQVATLLGQQAGALGSFACLGRGKPFRDEEPLSESGSELHLARVT